MKLSGVLPALVTPFDAKGDIDFKAFECTGKSLEARFRFHAAVDQQVSGFQAHQIHVDQTE